jgi:hypothetical protein
VKKEKKGKEKREKEINGGWKEGRKEGSKEEGRKQLRKYGRWEEVKGMEGKGGRKEGRKEGRKIGREGK